ncbi:malonate transporter MadL subunit [Advenella kashmirensis WT001]|uniref:Malonate transporter MadL subunit n=1 Tax=Advenella kashmirensis (strain DSM 17095 / LMG 22695 / WT001) TaxID=1036672 RepID=I3U932_ADVKW|nr:malonate transporter MadL subunit [Advenella kashmirensis WT001]
MQHESLSAQKTLNYTAKTSGDKTMIIYGTAILAACHLLGVYIGDLLGMLIGVKANVVESASL